MPSMKAIKRKIISVGNMKQIMKAMNLVSASKLQRSKNHLEGARPIVIEATRVIDSLEDRGDVTENVFIKRRTVKRAAYVVVSGDRGLCGGYNTNICKEVLAAIERNGAPDAGIISVGTRGYEFFLRNNINVIKLYAGVSEKALYKDAKIIGRFITDIYLSGEVDEVYVAYTWFKSTLSHKPRVERLFPMGSGKPPSYSYEVMSCEPDADTVLNAAAQMYAEMFIFGAMAESSACEQAARMVSMDSATKNATDIIDDLTIKFNRIRQDSITNELNEIVSATNALS